MFTRRHHFAGNANKVEHFDTLLGCKYPMAVFLSLQKWKIEENHVQKPPHQQ